MGLSYLAGRLLTNRWGNAQNASTLVPQSPGAEIPTVTPEVKPAPPPVPTQSQKLQTLINKFAKTQPADFHIYVEDLKTGAKATLREHTSVPSGSIYKLFLANQIYKLNEAGKLNMGSYVSGTNYTFAGCTMQMVQNSLNFCGETVRAHLGAVEHTKLLQKQGYKDTSLMRNDAAHTSAADVALILKRVYRGNYFNKAHSAEFLGYLRNQLWRFRIPTGIPPAVLSSGGATTYNKTGDVFSYANDGAIIEGEKTKFVLVIMSGGWKTVFPDSSIAIRHLTGLVYNFLNKTKHLLAY